MASTFWLIRGETITYEYEDGPHIIFQCLYAGFVVNQGLLSVQGPQIIGTIVKVLRLVLSAEFFRRLAWDSDHQVATSQWYETHRFLRAVAGLILLALTFRTVLDLDHTTISTLKRRRGRRNPTLTFCPSFYITPSVSFTEHHGRATCAERCGTSVEAGTASAHVFKFSARRYGKFRHRRVHDTLGHSFKLKHRFS